MRDFFNDIQDISKNLRPITNGIGKRIKNKKENELGLGNCSIGRVALDMTKNTVNYTENSATNAIKDGEDSILSWLRVNTLDITIKVLLK